MEAKHTEAMRAEFEAWYEADAMPCESNWFRRDLHDPEEYDFPHTQIAWKAWQAASAGKAELLEALKLVMNYPEVRSYLGGIVSTKADAAISRATGEQDTGRESNG